MTFFPGTAGWYKENKMPYRETQIEQLMETNERLERALERKEEEITRLKNEIDSLEEDLATARSRRRGFFGSADREKLEEEVVGLRGELDLAAKQLEEAVGDCAREQALVKKEGERSLKLMTERDKLKGELREATGLRAHAIAVELVHAHLHDPDWLPNSVAMAAVENSGLAAKILELQREREAVANAQNDLPGVPSSNVRDLVQLLVGPNRHTIILPLRHAMTAIRAAVECWGQEVMEKAKAMKGSL